MRRPSAARSPVGSLAMPIKVRIRPEMVVEVLDPTAIAAFNMDWDHDAEGNAGMIEFPFTLQVQNAVMMTIAQALEHQGPKARLQVPRKRLYRSDRGRTTRITTWWRGHRTRLVIATGPGRSAVVSACARRGASSQVTGQQGRT